MDGATAVQGQGLANECTFDDILAGLGVNSFGKFDRVEIGRKIPEYAHVSAEHDLRSGRCQIAATIRFVKFGAIRSSSGSSLVAPGKAIG